MTIEERLRELILKRYGTLKNFTSVISISNSTFSNIIRRGIMNANVLTIIKICKELNIDAEALSEGRIVPVDHIEEEPTAIEDVIDSMKQTLLNSPVMTIDGYQATAQQITSLVNSIEITYEVWKNQTAQTQRLMTYAKKMKKDDK